MQIKAVQWKIEKTLVFSRLLRLLDASAWIVLHYAKGRSGRRGRVFESRRFDDGKAPGTLDFGTSGAFYLHNSV